MQIGNPEEIFSGHSYNRYEILYESLFQEHPLEIIVETNCYQPVYPAEPHKVESFVGMFCETNGLKLPRPFEAADIVPDVQSVERTFIDKVFAVCDYRLRDMQNRDSRHLYDDLSYEEAVKNGIAIVAESDIFGAFDSSESGV